MVHKLFIMLGNECNISCKYCMQHNLVTHSIAKEISPRFCDYLLACHEENPKMHVIFYGGEPLIYFPVIQKIMESFPFLDGKAGIISNGKALTDEMVEFINKHKMDLTISWDGLHVMNTRRFDVFRSPERKHRILRVERLCLTGVCSAYAYPLEILESFEKVNTLYESLHGYPVGVNVDTVFDTGMPDKSLLAVDYERVEKEVKQLFSEYVEISEGKRKPSYVRLQFIERALRSLLHPLKGARCYCGNGYSVMNVDLEGNLYECHNVSESIGRTDGDRDSYLRKLFRRDGTEKRRQTICTSCEALPICKGGCKLMTDDNLDAYCKLKKAVYGTIANCAKEYVKGVIYD